MRSARPLRVAVFSELPTPYRWPVYERLLGQKELDLEVFFCARTEKDRAWRFEFSPDDRVRFLPVSTFSMSGRRTIHYHLNHTLFGALRRGGFQVAVFPGYAMFASQAGALWCRATGTPYVVFSETTELDRRRWPVRALKRILVPKIVAGAGAWLATGSLSRRYLISYGAREDEIFLFPNTPDVQAFRRRSLAAGGERSRARRELGAGGRPVVLFVGRLLKVKRCDLILDAISRLAAEGREPACWFAGEGPERRRLSEHADRLGLEGVRFLGNVPTRELPSIYGAADIFVLPSDHEPWGAVVCEAMACSLPIVLSDRVGSAPDLVVEGENGHVFRRGDADALAMVLDRLLSDLARLRRMGARSWERISRWTPRECVEGFLSAVRTAARNGGRA